MLAYLPRDVGDQRHKQSDSSAPVTSVEIAVSSMPAVHAWYIDMAALDDPVVHTHDGCDRAEEDC